MARSPVGFPRRHRLEQIRTGSGGGSGVAHGAAGIAGKPRAVLPVTGAVAQGANPVSNGQHVRDLGDNHNDIKEVIHSNNNH